MVYELYLNQANTHPHTHLCMYNLLLRKHLDCDWIVTKLQYSHIGTLLKLNFSRRILGIIEI